jgi:hypothetical protein
MPPAKRGLSNSPSREYKDVGGGEGDGGLDIVLACNFFEVRGTTSPNFAERDFVDATTPLQRLSRTSFPDLSLYSSCFLYCAGIYIIFSSREPVIPGHGPCGIFSAC